MNTLATSLFALGLGTVALATHAQNVGIGTSSPNPRAALEIQASDRGLLIPRLTAGQRTAISAPPQGLLVYQTDNSAGGGPQTGFWYYGGSGGWVYLDASAGGGSLSLPYSGAASSSRTTFEVSNTGAGPALSATGAGAALAAPAILGNNTSAATSATGVLGQTLGGYGVRGTASAGGGYGVSGEATDSYGVIGSSQSGVAVYGTTSNNSLSGGAVVGSNNSTGTAAVGVLGLTKGGYGVRGEATATGGYGVAGLATDSYGVYGQSTSGSAVRGTSSSGSGVAGQSNSGFGVGGQSSSGSGLYGVTASANVGGVAGVLGLSTNSSGIGVLGQTASGYGVRGEATGSSGDGVSGTASGNNGYALLGSATGGANGLYATASGTGRAAYFNQTSTSGTANALEVQNTSLGNTAFFTLNNSNSTASALELQSNSYSGHTLQLTGQGALNRTGSIGFQVPDATVQSATIVASRQSLFGAPIGGLTISCLSTDGNLHRALAIGGETNNGKAIVSGLLYDNWQVTGNMYINGSLSVVGTKAFRIDHPLDPENKYLYHSCVESPDMMNIYNGNATLDAHGEATVQLPTYFEALNQDFRYQLTPIGAAFTPYVLAKVKGNQFRIAGQPGAEVSWQVTGIRHDRAAQAQPVVPETAKEPENRGKYLRPDAYGLPAERGIGYQPVRVAALPRR